MADRIQIGVGPRISYDESRRISFSGGNKEVLTRDQYQNSYVDFFNQTLGMPTLGEETGIDVSTPEIAGDSTRQDNSDGYEDSQTILQTNLNKALAGDPGPFGGTFKYGADAYNPDFDLNAHLQKNNPDRVNIFTSLVGPLATGNFSDVDLGVVFDSTAEKVTELPGSVGKTATELKRKGFVKTLEANKEKAASTLFGMLGGIPGAVVGSFIGGKADKNGFGNTSFRPGGALGGVFDFLTAKQSDHITQIKQAMNDSGASAKGFAMTLGNFGITRPPGSNAYTGNMRGMSHVQVKALEALSKGYVPSGYNIVTETGKKLTDEGYTTGQLSTGSFYRDDGSVMSADGRTVAGYGYDRDAKALAEKFGLDYSTSKQDVLTVINDARRNGGGLEAGMITLSENNITSSTNFYGADSGVAGTGAVVAPDNYNYDEGTDLEGPPTDSSVTQYDTPEFDGSGGDTGQGGYDDNQAAQDRQEAADEATGDGRSGGPEDGRALGGRIGMAAGGQMAAGMEPSGFIGAPPSQVPEGQTVADNVNTQKPEGTFVINAAAVEFAGEQDIVKMLNDAQKEAVRRGIALDNDESSGKLIDVAVSRGEVTVAPYLVKIIGEDRLTKINNRGKPETQERIEENGQQMAAQGGFIGLANGGTANSSENYEDKIIVDEVRRKMEAIFKIAEDRGLDVTSEYPGPEEQKYFEDIARLNPGTQPITGSWSANPGEMNVPKTPTLFNLFALAEEMAHTEYFDSEGPSFMDELEKYSPIYRYNQSKRGPLEKDFERTFNRNEEAYAEEMRAKSIAYEVVGGLLPKSKATTEMTVDNYANHFYDYLRDNAEKPIIEAMLKKYPDMAGRKRVVFPEYENEYPDIESVQAKAEGGFLGFLDSINPFSSSEEEAPQQGFATVPVTPTGPQPVQAGTEYAGDEGDDIPETALQAPPAFVAQLEQHYKKPVTRTQNKKLYDKMSNEQLLAHMLMAETKSSTDPEEAMYAVGQTAIHRRNSNEPEFRKQKSLRDVLLKRLSKGAFEYAGMDVKRNKGLKENFTTNRANYERGLARATVIAQDLLGGEMESDPAVSPDVMWYTRQDAPNQWMRNNLTLVEIIGEHEFYKAPD